MAITHSFRVAAFCFFDTMQGLAVGKIVHYSETDWLKTEHGALVCRAATVVEVEDATTGRVRLAYLTPHQVLFASADFAEQPAQGTWHWPERVDA